MDSSGTYSSTDSTSSISSDSSSLSSSSSSDEELVLFLVTYRLRKKRRYWMHPRATKRDEDGEFHRLMLELKMYNERFRGFFRMSVGEFEQLLQQLAPALRKEHTHFRKPIDPEQRLAVCLRFLSTGESYHTIATSFHLGVSTVGAIVSETCNAIWNTLKDEHIPKPSQEMWRRTATRFYDKLNFPNCLGALGGKHIFIKHPAHSASLYMNYKSSCSVVLLALVDADYRFLVVDVGSYGGNSDGGIFMNSVLGKDLREGTLNVPPPIELHGAPELGKVNHVFVADEAFPLKPFLLRPYPGRRSTFPIDKTIFNDHLSQAHAVSEKAFRILSQRFRVFQRTLQVQPTVADKILKATVALCNFLHPNADDHDQATEEDCEQTLQSFEHCRGCRSSLEAQAVRELFKSYFSFEVSQHLDPSKQRL